MGPSRKVCFLRLVLQLKNQSHKTLTTSSSNVIHHSDVTVRLKSQATWVINNLPGQQQRKHKSSTLLDLCEDQWSVRALHTGPVMQKSCLHVMTLSYGVKMSQKDTGSWLLTYDRMSGYWMRGSFDLSRSSFTVSLHNLITLRPRQNYRHFADHIFKYIFFNENVWISLNISLKFVPKLGINNIPSLVLITAWRRIGDRPLSKPMLTWFTDAYMRH